MVDLPPTPESLLTNISELLASLAEVSRRVPDDYNLETGLQGSGNWEPPKEWNILTAVWERRADIFWLGAEIERFLGNNQVPKAWEYKPYIWAYMNVVIRNLIRLREDVALEEDQIAMVNTLENLLTELTKLLENNNTSS